VGSTIALQSGKVSLRIIRGKDARVLETLVLSNREWLKPWEATNPDARIVFDFRGMVRSLIRQYDQQTGLPFVIEYDGQVVGQLNVANILYGAVSSAVIGYWVIPSVAGQGVTQRRWRSLPTI
jgi:ribosomal-protein-alanine N-acetyltransferase